MKKNLRLLSIILFGLGGCQKSKPLNVPTTAATPIFTPGPVEAAKPPLKLSQITHAAKNWKLFLLVPDAKSPFLTPLIMAARREAKTIGVSLSVNETKSLKNLPIQNADALLIVPSVPQLPLLQAIQEKRRRDSIIIAVNAPLEDQYLGSVGLPVHGFVGPDHHQAGVLVGRAMAKALGKKASPIFMMTREFSVKEGQFQSLQRMNGFVEGLRVTSPYYKHGETSSFGKAAANASEARNQVYGFRYNDKNLRGVFASDDELALGALDMIKPNEKIFVVGYGALPSAKKAIQSGRLLATIEPNPSITGSNAVRLAVGLLDKRIKGSNTRIVPLSYFTPIKLIQKPKR